MRAKPRSAQIPTGRLGPRQLPKTYVFHPGVLLGALTAPPGIAAAPARETDARQQRYYAKQVLHLEMRAAGSGQRGSGCKCVDDDGPYSYLAYHTVLGFKDA